MKQRFLFLVALVVVMVLTPVGVALAGPATTFNVTGTGTTIIAGVQVPVNFNGTFDIKKFEVQNNKLVAIGALSGTVTKTDGTQLPGSVSLKSVTIPVISGGSQAASASRELGVSQTCDILHLVLGPLDLNLLGLVVHLDQIVLDIDAEGGQGNLLGNLLCAIVGLFDGGGPLNIIADLLNSLLDLLNWVG
jgi:hypothetical protein